MTTSYIYCGDLYFGKSVIFTLEPHPCPRLQCNTSHSHNWFHVSCNRLCYVVVFSQNYSPVLTLGKIWSVFQSNLICVLPYCCVQYWVSNSLVPGRSIWMHFRNVIFNLVLLTGIFRSSYDDALRWISRNLSDNKWTLFQVMACF